LKYGKALHFTGDGLHNLNAGGACAMIPPKKNGLVISPRSSLHRYCGPMEDHQYQHVAITDGD
jgi:hypothetical protein